MNTKPDAKIHSSMTIDSILHGFPNHSKALEDAITKAGLQCVGCHASNWETLQDGMNKHGYPQEAIHNLVEQLNTILKDGASQAENLETIEISPTAAKYFVQFATEEGKKNAALRFGEESSGCGHKYILDFSDNAEPDDAVFTSHGIHIHVKQKLLQRLLGSFIDYIEHPTSGGFKVKNRKAKSSCGCGSAHKY